MHNSFYASGFLYNLKAHQILLLSSQKMDNTVPIYSMLGGESYEGEEAQATFQRIINDILDLNLKNKDIYPIYDYFHETLEKINYVFYAEVKRVPPLSPSQKNTFSWVNFSETPKLPFSNHTKQDVIVAERVINLKMRLDNNLQF